MLAGWKRYKDYHDARVRARFEWEVRQLKSAYNASLWAMEKRLKHANQSISQQIRALRKEVEKEFGPTCRSTRAFLGPLLLWASKREDKRLAKGKTYEPPTIIERRNWVEA